MKNIAIIGGNSFIASYIIEELHARGFKVTSLQRHFKESFGSYQNHYWEADTTYIGDIKDSEVVEKVVASSDGVINLAGILGTSETVNNPIPAIEVNILGTINVLNACRIWDKPFVQIAVGNYYMDNTYSITRTTAERFTKMYAKEHGLKANVVRALNAYGARQTYASYKKLIPGFILNALRNKPLHVYGNGDQVMDFIHATDLAKFMVDTLLEPEKVRLEVNQELLNAYDKTNKDVEQSIQVNLPKPELLTNAYGNIYQCGEGDGLTVNKIAEIIKDLTGSSSQIIHTPMRQGEPENARVVADYQSPTFNIEFIEGIKSTIGWYKDNIDKYNV